MKNRPILRRAVEEDFRNLHRMMVSLLTYEHENFDNSLRLDWANCEAAKNALLSAIQTCIVFIIYHEEEAIGYLLGRISEPSANSARGIKQGLLENIYIEPEWRKCGLGRRLIDVFKDDCKEHGAECINVTVLANNQDARAFYEKMGLLPRNIVYSGKI